MNARAKAGTLRAMYHRWTARTQSNDPSWIMPDGCRDVIWSQRPGAAPQVEFSRVDLSARQVSAPVGTRFFGYRLPPGVGLARSIEDTADPDRIGAMIDERMSVDPDVTGILDQLGTPGTTLAQAIAASGLSERSVERKFRKRGLPRPDIWRQMVQARRAAQCIHQAESLADMAAEAGYSDQAHMTRAFRRWFAATPGQIARDATLARSIAQSGVGNWTAVQSSTS